MAIEMMWAVCAAAGLLIGTLAAWLLTRRPGQKAELADARTRLQQELERRSAAEAQLARIPELEKIITQRDRAIAVFQDERTEHVRTIEGLDRDLAHERASATEKLALIDDAQKKLKDAFDALAHSALSNNNEQFLQLARQSFSAIQESARGDLESRRLAVEGLVKPLGDALKSVDQKITELETARAGAYATLTEQIRSLGDTQERLKSETNNLVHALKTPQVRGRWGEVRLRRLIELAGMLEYCEFLEQPSVDSEDGRLRPDIIVQLPNNRVVIIDSKVPDQDYNLAMDAQDEQTRAATLREHARRVRDHFNRLGSKAYWRQFENSAEFVVMFLPMESFFMAALEHDPELVSDAVSQGVIMATPTTLLALLKAVHYGWRHEKLTQNAREIKQLGEELYGRIGGFLVHFDRVGDGLRSAGKVYNAAVGSLDARVLVTARRIRELAAIQEGELQTPALVETEIRQLRTPEIASAVILEPSPEPVADNGSHANGN